MKVHMIVPTVLSAMLLSAPALAVGNPSKSDEGGSHHLRMNTSSIDERCMILQQQYDEAAMNYERAGKVNEQKLIRTPGNLCTSGNSAQGVVQLQQDIRALGMKPNA
jgi:hypothetical protein